MASDPTTIESLPNEIVISILSSLPTPSLLPLAAISRRFHALVLRLLHHRLTSAASAQDRQLILECYHPSAQLTTPYLYCDYLGTTAGLDGGPSSFVDLPDGVGSGSGGEGYVPESIAALKSLYSHFRPVPQEENRRARLRYPRTSQQPGHGVGGGGGGSSSAAAAAAEEPPTLDVHLEDCEMFSQLCAVTNMVKMGPRRGLFTSHVNVSDGLIRVWRPWLAEAAAEGSRMALDEEEGEGSKREAILWADSEQNVGVRFRAYDRSGNVPVLVGRDEDLPVSYRLEYEELVVRTSQLLLMSEKSDVQEDTSSGKAIVIASI